MLRAKFSRISEKHFLYSNIKEKKVSEYVLISMTFTENIGSEVCRITQVYIYFNLFEGLGVIPVIKNWNKKIVIHISFDRCKFFYNHPSHTTSTILYIWKLNFIKGITLFFKLAM